MKSKIKLNKIELFGYHGVNRDEIKNGQKFEIDVEVYHDITKAIRIDDISMTVDYAKLYENVVNVFSSSRYNLIEHLGYKILDSIMHTFTVSSCKVIIRKPDVPINGKLESIEVEVTQER